MQKHLPALDGLRGIAALAVVGWHFREYSGLGLAGGQEYLAVDLFFVLSGFVIGQAYEGRLNDGLSWPRYMALRAARLYPAIFMGTALGFAFALITHGPNSNLFVLFQFLLLPAIGVGALFPLDGPLWSLLFEVSVNAIHAALFRSLTIARLVLIMAVAAAALAVAVLGFGSLNVGYAWGNAWGGVPRVIYSFSAGLLIFRARAEGLKAPRAPFWIVAAIFIACVTARLPRVGPFHMGDLVIVLLVLPSLVAVAIESSAPPFLDRVLVWLGALSYPLYAIHRPLMDWSTLVLGGLNGSAKVIGWIIVSGVIIAIAGLTERFYDAPIRRLLRREQQRATGALSVGDLSGSG